jgi:hypothetical protein
MVTQDLVIFLNTLVCFPILAKNSNSSCTKDLTSQISENHVAELVPKKVLEKYKPILPAPPAVQQPQLMLAGTLHNYKNMTPVYLVLTSAGKEQSKS